MNRWMDGWMDEWMEEYMGRGVDGWVSGWIEGWMAGWLAGWFGGHPSIYHLPPHLNENDHQLCSRAGLVPIPGSAFYFCVILDKPPYLFSEP